MAAHRYWRVSNIIDRTAHETRAVACSIVKFISNGTEQDTSDFTKILFDTEHTSTDYAAKNAFDGNESTRYSSYSVSWYVSSMSAYLGFDFTDPVEITEIGYKPRGDMKREWGQEWQKCIVEYSDDGENWFIEGQCNFNTPKMDLSYRTAQIEPIESPSGNKYRYWRVAKVKTVENPDNFTSDFDVWEIRFRNVENIVSVNPRNGFAPNWWRNSDNQFWEPSNPFDGYYRHYNSRITGGTLMAGGAHPRETGDENWHIGYDFIYPVEVREIQVMMRKDGSEYWDRNWISCLIQKSNDKTNWVDAGYAHFAMQNYGNSSSKPFYFSTIQENHVLAKDYYSGVHSDIDIYREADTSIEQLNFDPDFDYSHDIEIINSPYHPVYANALYNDGDIKNGLGGLGYIAGVTKKLGIIEPNIRVTLHHRKTSELLATTYSDSEGKYKFTNLIVDLEYFVHAVDHKRDFNAVTQDILKAKKYEY